MADNLTIFNPALNHNAPDVFDGVNRMMLDLHVASGLRTKVAYTPTTDVTALTDGVIWFEDNFYIPTGVTEFSFVDDGVIHVWTWNVDTWDETTFTAVEYDPSPGPITEISDGVTHNGTHFIIPDGVTSFTFKDNDVDMEATYDDGWSFDEVGETPGPSDLTSDYRVIEDGNMILSGMLYNGHGLERTGNEGVVAPEGWRVATDDDRSALSDFIGSEDRGIKLKTRRTAIPSGSDPQVGIPTDVHPKFAYHETNFGNDEYGYAALPTGLRESNGIFRPGTDLVSYSSCIAFYTPSENPRRQVMTHNSTGVVHYTHANLRREAYAARFIRESSTGWEEGDTVADLDGNVYDTVQIDSQIWAVQNITALIYKQSIPAGWRERVGDSGTEFPEPSSALTSTYFYNTETSQLFRHSHTSSNEWILVDDANVSVGTSEPGSPAVGDYWLDTSDNTLYRYFLEESAIPITSGDADWAYAGRHGDAAACHYQNTESNSFIAGNHIIFKDFEGANDNNYEFSIDGGSNWQKDPWFLDLSAGTYNLRVRDEDNTEDVLNLSQIIIA